MAQRFAVHSQPASRPLGRALKGTLCGLSLCLVAGAALAAVAGLLGAGQVQPLAQEIQQRDARVG